MIRTERLRAMSRLLDYAVAESQELGLPNLEQLLGAAALELDDALVVANTRSDLRGPQIKLVVDAGNGTTKAARPRPVLGLPASAR
jgi:hypothetical protein